MARTNFISVEYADHNHEICQQGILDEAAVEFANPIMIALVMAEAPKEWKVELLREIINAGDPNTAHFWAEFGSKEYNWFVDMERDGLVCGEYGTHSSLQDAMSQNRVIPLGSRSGFFNLHVPEKGKTFIEDYDSKTTFRGIANRWTFPALKWILIAVLGVAFAAFLAFLLHEYGLK